MKRIIKNKHQRRNINNEIFSEMLVSSYNNEISDMFSWVMGCNRIFPSKSEYENFIEDFLLWCTYKNILFFS